MKSLTRILLAIFLCVAGAASAEDDPYMGGFDGRWEGTLHFVAAEAYDKDHGYKSTDAEYAFEVKNNAVNVFIKQDGRWGEYNRGGFHIFSHKTNAVIVSILSNNGDAETLNGTWVETWNFTITHKDANALYVVYARAVNNFLLPYDYNKDKETGRFFTVANGEFVRVVPSGGI